MTLAAKHPIIVCRFCGHGKVWHQDEGRCYFDHECNCEAWDYGVNVEPSDDE